VARLSTDLRTHGVDIVLDQWDLQLGQDLTRFMEQGITESDRVLLICTLAYGRKAGEGQGGVGYERLVVTAEIAEKTDTSKFVCVLRDGERSDSIPPFARTRLFVDFREDENYAVHLEELLRDLLKAPAQPKPPLGPNPFEGGAQSTGLTGFALDLADESAPAGNVESAYARAMSLLRQHDMLGWKSLVRNTRRELGSNLSLWRSRIEKEQLGPDRWLGEFCRAISAAAPLFSLALCAVDSEIESVRDQRAVIDDLLSLREWDHNGPSVVVATPSGLAFVYHHILGALLLDLGRRADAIRLLTTRVRDGSGDTVEQIWRERELIGWPTSLDANWALAWRFLHSLPQTQRWLMHFFVDDASFLRALRAYNLTASLLELSARLANDPQPGALTTGRIEHVPPMFAQGGDLAAIVTAAVPDRSVLASVGQEFHVEPRELRQAWPGWCEAVTTWFANAGDRRVAFMLRRPPELP
jgi:hypothetical protein